VERALSTIAEEILADWKNPLPAAKPFISAMVKIDSIDENHFGLPASAIVIQFLSNSRTWKGKTAKRIKTELKLMLSLPIDNRRI